MTFGWLNLNPWQPVLVEEVVEAFGYKLTFSRTTMTLQSNMAFNRNVRNKLFQFFFIASAINTHGEIMHKKYED